MIFNGAKLFDNFVDVCMPIETGDPAIRISIFREKQLFIFKSEDTVFDLDRIKTFLCGKQRALSNFRAYKNEFCVVNSFTTSDLTF
jgi:hypothetical protein